MKPFRFIACCFVIGLLSSCSERVEPTEVGLLSSSVSGIYRGVIKKHGWSKTQGSYCHGGSEYYVLDAEQGELTIESDRSGKKRTISLEMLSELAGSRVEITGNLVTRTYRPEEHCCETCQCPVSPTTTSPSGGKDWQVAPLSCSYLEVIDIGTISLTEIQDLN